MKKTLMLAAAALAFVGCGGEVTDSAELPTSDQPEVVTPPADEALMDPPASDDDLLMDDELNSEMTEGEILTDEPM